MKLWRVVIYNYFGNLINSWFYSSRTAATEHGEQWADEMGGSFKVVYAGVHPFTISASDPAVIVPFDEKTSDGETIYFDSFDEFNRILNDTGGIFKVRG